MYSRKPTNSICPVCPYPNILRPTLLSLTLYVRYIDCCLLSLFLLIYHDSVESPILCIPSPSSASSFLQPSYWSTSAWRSRPQVLYKPTCIQRTFPTDNISTYAATAHRCSRPLEKGLLSQRSKWEKVTGPNAERCKHTDGCFSPIPTISRFALFPILLTEIA